MRPGHGHDGTRPVPAPAAPCRARTGALPHGQGRLTKLFDGLAEGGNVKVPLPAQSAGAAVGWFTDKFGINWMVSIDKA